MATADKLLKLILCWIEEKERFADNLMKLAEELESLRAKCNVGECVGSTVTVVGAAGMIGAGVATLLTGGAGLPLFQLATQVTQIGSGISHVTKIIEELHNSKTMKKVKDVEEKSNIIAEEIQQLFQKLKSEKKEANPLLNPDELEHQIMAEFLRAIVRQSGLNVQIINDSMLNGMLSRTLLEYPPETFSDVHSHTLQESPLETFSDEHSRRSGGGSWSAGTRRRSELESTLEEDFEDCMVFSDSMLKNNKLVKFPLLSAVGFLSATLIFIHLKGKRVQLSGTVLKFLRSIGFQTAIQAGVMVAGGVGVMLCALPEMIDNWTELINGNHVTEASQSLRDTVYAIREVIRIMKRELKTTQQMLQEIEQEQQRLQELEEEESSDEEDECRPAVKVGLLNVRSIKEMETKRDDIRELITIKELDVVLLTETWLDNDTAAEALSKTVPPNFDFYQQSREGRGGGVAILFSKELDSEIVNFKLTITAFEYVAIALKHKKWNKKVLFINVYRPPASRFIYQFHMLLKQASTYSSVIMAGDFNVYAKNTSGENIRLFEMAYKCHHYVQHVKKPTHVRGGILDLVFSRNVKVKNVDICGNNISDHFTVLFNIKPKDVKTKANLFKKEE